MDVRVSSITSHLSYRCAKCQMDLNLGPVAAVNKSDFIFYREDESRINEQPSGLLCGIYPAKMRVRSCVCRAKLGFSGNSLSFVDRKKYAYKLTSDALNIIVNHYKVAEDAGTEKMAVKESPFLQETRKEIATGNSAAIPPEAAAEEAHKEITPPSIREIKKKDCPSNS